MSLLGYSAVQEQRIYDDLFGENKTFNVPPINDASGPMQVEVGFALHRIVDLVSGETAPQSHVVKSWISNSRPTSCMIIIIIIIIIKLKVYFRPGRRPIFSTA